MNEVFTVTHILKVLNEFVQNGYRLYVPIYSDEYDKYSHKEGVLTIEEAYSLLTSGKTVYSDTPFEIWRIRKRKDDTYSVMKL